jgi:hypothetical protein
MKPGYLLLFAFMVATIFGCQPAAAQIQLRLPRLPGAKPPKQAEPKPEAARSDGNPTGQRERGARPMRGRRENIYYSRPVPTSQPVFLRDTVEITLQTKNTYWKFPNQNDYTSWVPRVIFEVFYDDSAKLRYTAEWFNPDGSPWFSEALSYTYTGNMTARITSEYSSDELQAKRPQPPAASLA